MFLRVRIHLYSSSLHRKIYIWCKIHTTENPLKIAPVSLGQSISHIVTHYHNRKFGGRSRRCGYNNIQCKTYRVTDQSTRIS